MTLIGGIIIAFLIIPINIIYLMDARLHIGMLGLMIVRIYVIMLHIVAVYD